MNGYEAQGYWRASAAMAGRQPDDDPRPVPPPEPDINACCGQGCSPCIFDLYELEREKYEATLRAWEERQAARARSAGTSSATRKG
ncbi:MAG TPA: oxidoreductase-like domain-containing protein [Burkholderiaceae bacterium]|nr:oxidoreductase-like domain-containing protein [Burkholderiaceae bacterium]